MTGTMAPKKNENEKQSSNVFIRDDEYGWRPAVQEKINGNKAIVRVPDYPSEQAMACDGGRNAKKGVTREINLKDYPSNVLPLQNVDANGDLIECADMVKLPYLHEVGQLELIALADTTILNFSNNFNLTRRRLSCTT